MPWGVENPLKGSEACKKVVNDFQTVAGQGCPSTRSAGEEGVLQCCLRALRGQGVSIYVLLRAWGL